MAGAELRGEYGRLPRWINGKQRKAKSAIFMLMNIIFLCLLSLLRKVSQINSLKWHFSILMMSPRLRLASSSSSSGSLSNCLATLPCPLLRDNEFYFFTMGNECAMEQSKLKPRPIQPNWIQLNWTELNRTEFGANCARTTVNPPLKCRINNRITVYYLSLITCNDNYQCLPACLPGRLLDCSAVGRRRGVEKEGGGERMVEKFTLLGNKHFNLFASIRQLAELFCVQCCVMRKVQIASLRQFHG